jgi:hypothetical protein
LREAQREQTLSVIHRAAVGLALQEGVAAATADRIAGLAGVSERTLFNYHPVKDNAILGVRAPMISQAAEWRFTAGRGHPVLSRVERVQTLPGLQGPGANRRAVPSASPITSPDSRWCVRAASTAACHGDEAGSADSVWTWSSPATIMGPAEA